MDRLLNGPLDGWNEAFAIALALTPLIGLSLALFVRKVRDFMRIHAGRLAGVNYQPGYATTLLGLIIAMVIFLISNRQNDLAKFEGALLLLSAAALYTLAHLVLDSMVYWLTIYFANATIQGSWWCLAWALFAVLNPIVPEQGWRFLILLAPLVVITGSLSSIVPMLVQTIPLKVPKNKEPSHTG